MRKPTLFLSYAWRYDLGDVYTALMAQGLLEHVVWTDILSINQNHTESTDFLADFDRSVKACGHTAFFIGTPWVLDTSPSSMSPLSRIWCIFEVFRTVALGCTLQVVLPAGTHEFTTFHALLLAAGRCDGCVDIRLANATKPEDIDMILNLVGDRAEDVNAKVEAAIRASAREVLKGPWLGGGKAGQRWTDDQVDIVVGWVQEHWKASKLAVDASAETDSVSDDTSMPPPHAPPPQVLLPDAPSMSSPAKPARLKPISEQLPEHDMLRAFDEGAVASALCHQQFSEVRRQWCIPQDAPNPAQSKMANVNHFGFKFARAPVRHHGIED